ncbi:unnamed protein product [Prorocentrum cordatum]|uniref:Serine aminopeptidase S33 domain-containing protein n=1 Tax=Prorocentrum cordatum TaxID=2364126 RepID=A0ABN9XXN5_9DINO|nr:unnamed protein product [Polarella glacialis]
MASILTSIRQTCSGCDAAICCIGCASLAPCGIIERVVDKISFLPPRPPGYHITQESVIYLIESDYGLQPMPDYTADGITVEAVTMQTRRGNSIQGFHMRHTSACRLRRTLLFSHANSTDIGIMFRRVVELCARLHVNVFAYEYSGYGECTGTPSEADIYADVEAAYDHLTTRCGIPGEHIVCYGQSIGTVPSTYLASIAKVGGVILHSGMTSGLGVILEVNKDYSFDVFKNAARLKAVTAPVFVMHGTNDIEIPFSHGLALYEACPEEFAYPPWWVTDGGHNDIDINFRQQYFEQLAHYLGALDAGTWKAEPRQGPSARLSGSSRRTSLTPRELSRERPGVEPSRERSGARSVGRP